MNDIAVALSGQLGTAGNIFGSFGSWLTDSLSWILTTVESVDPVLRTLIAGFGILLETSVLVGLIVPGDTIVIVASTAVTSPPEFLFLCLAVILGALGGESIGFALGRYFGPRIRHSKLGARIGEAHWARADRYLARRGGIAVFISRFLPVLHSLIPITVGMSKMSYRTFMKWTAPACVIWTGAYVSVGTFAAGSFRELLDSLHGAGYIFVGIIAVFALGVFVAKKVLQRNEERHMAHDAVAPDTTASEKTSAE